MANVSKINFNGEELDVKDTYAREQILHKTADNYTADVTGDYTINAGGISMSSANATMHTTANRTIDTDGNDSVHINGDSTLNVGGLRTETFAGDKTETVTGTVTEKAENRNTTVTGTVTEKAENRNTTVTGKWKVNLPSRSFDMENVALKTDILNLPFLDVTQHGVSADADDNSAAINAAITQYWNKYTLYFPRGTYNIKSPIMINKHEVHIVCDGTIYATGDCFHVTSSGVVLDVYSILGNRTGIGLLMQSGATAIGNSKISIQFINGFTTGIKLLSGAEGIQNNVFNLLRIDRFTTGIELACDNTGKGWINENKFYNAWCFGYDATETAVKFTKGAKQTDPFNGNRFINFSGEGCKTLFNLNFAHRNTFENFRLIEQSLADTIVCSADSSENVFSSDNSMLDYKCINDKGNNNIYNMLFHSDGNPLCRQMITLQGLFMASSHAPYYDKSSFAFSKSGFVPEHKLATWITISNASTDEMTVVLPIAANFPQVGLPFTIETGDIKGPTKVIGYGGQLIATSVDRSGDSGIQLKPWYKYTFYTTFYGKYKVFSVASEA